MARYRARFQYRHRDRRTALCDARRADAAHAPEYLHHAQQPVADRAADAYLGLLSSRQRHRRRGQSLGGDHLPLSAARISAEELSHRAVRCRRDARRVDVAGLGHHLGRDGAALYAVRARGGHVRLRGQPQRREARRRQPVRRPAQRRISDAAAASALRPDAVRTGGERDGLSALPGALVAGLRGLYQSLRRHHGPLHLLRLLHQLRLRQLLQSQRHYHRAARADAQRELYRLYQLRSAGGADRLQRQKSDRRHLCRLLRRYLGTASRSGDCRRLYL